MDILGVILHAKKESVGFCHQDRGCKIAIDQLYSVNGIAKSPWNDTYYVANPHLGGMRVLSRQADDRLVLDDEIPTGLYHLIWLSARQTEVRM